MKYIKTFEGRTVNTILIKGLEDFFKEYDEHKNRLDYKSTYNSLILKANRYNIPEELFEDFSLFYFLHDNFLPYQRYRSMAIPINNYIKKEVKKFILNSIIKKIEDDVNLYLKIKNIFKLRPKWNDSGSFNKVSDMPVNYFYFLLKSAINKLPWLNDAQKFNL